MKRLALAALVLILTMLTAVSALALEGEFLWRGHPNALTHVEQIPSEDNF